MSRINSKTMVLASLLLLLGLLALGGFILERLKLLNKELGEIQAQISNLNFKLQNLKIFEKTLSENQTKKEIIEGLFLNEKEILRLIEDLEEIGRESGVSLKVEGAAFGSGPAGNGPSFRLTAEGDFKALFRYLLLVENLGYEIVFSEVRLQKSDSWNGFYVLKLLSYEF